MYKLECPYCGEEQTDPDLGGADQETTIIHECESCGKSFTFSYSLSIDYESAEAPCLNGDEHSWSCSWTYPEYLKKMRCIYCDEARELTDEERKKYNVPTRAEWEAQHNAK